MPGRQRKTMSEEATQNIEEILNKAVVLPMEMPETPDAPAGWLKVTPVSEMASVYVRINKIHSVIVKARDLPILAATGETLAEQDTLLMIESPEIGKVLNVIIEEPLEYVLEELAKNEP